MGRSDTNRMIGATEQGRWLAGVFTGTTAAR